jgi:alanine racemase
MSLELPHQVLAKPAWSWEVRRAYWGLIQSMDDILADESIAVRPTTAWVDLDALRVNYVAIRRHVGSAKMMAIVKANAFGHGLLRVARALEAMGVDQLGVAFLEEGIALRKAGIRCPILVLGGIIGNQISYFLEHDLQLTASSVYKVKQIDEAAEHRGIRAKIHLKLDTGMKRIGVRWENAPTLFEAALRAKNCDIEGVFSHFASSDRQDPQMARQQIECFNEAMSFFEHRSLPMPVRHLSNSGAVLQYPEANYEMVRPGCLLYGFYPSNEVARTVKVTPILTLKSRVVYFKQVPKATGVSYDGRWLASKDTRVVTIPVGYGDGYPRGLSGKAKVLINGKRYPIIGNITMDALMVDIGEDSAFNADEVVLLGRQKGEEIRVEELAQLLGTIPYEILTSINTRVPRRYLEGNLIPKSEIM